MDLFSQYATSYLENIHSQVSSRLTLAMEYESKYSSKKSIFIDAFIYFKRVKAYLLHQLAAVEVLKLLQDASCLIRIIALADEQVYRESDSVKVDLHLIDLLELLREKIVKLKSISSTTSILKVQLQTYQKRLSGWLFSIRKGWI